MRRLRMIGLIGVGAISSAAICSLYLAYTLSDPAFSGETASSDLAESESESLAERSQAYLVGFLADADPQVRTLAIWGLVSDANGSDRYHQVLGFARDEEDPFVRMTLYRF